MGGLRMIINNLFPLDNMIMVKSKRNYLMLNTITGWNCFSLNDYTCVEEYLPNHIKNKKGFIKYLEDMERVVNEEHLIYSLDEVEPPLFNLYIDQRIPAIPTDDYYNDYFDILFDSLCCGNTEQMDRLKQMIYWKWCCPFIKQKPLFIIDRGETGKTLLIDHLLPTIFGQDGVYNVPWGRGGPLSKGTNVVGKAVVNFNGVLFNKNNIIKLKNLTDKPVVEYKKKNSNPITGPNLAWYIITDFYTGAYKNMITNIMGNVELIANNKLRSIKHCINERWGGSLSNNELYNVIHNELIPVLKNREEVGKFLFCLYKEYENTQGVCYNDEN